MLQSCLCRQLWTTLDVIRTPLKSPDPKLQLDSGPWYGVPGHTYCYPTREAAEAEISGNSAIVTFETLREFLAWENEHSVSLPLTGELDDLPKM